MFGRHQKWILSLWAGLLLAACSLPEPELGRRYDSIVSSPSGSSPAVSVGLFSIPKPGGSAPNILSLSAEGQAEFVKAMSEKTTTPASLRAELSKALKGSGSLDKDFGSVSRRVIVSIFDEEGFGPADRLSKIELRIQVAPSSVFSNDSTLERPRFKSWSRLETDYQVIDLGKASSDLTNNLEATVKSDVPQISEILEANVTATRTRNLKEELELRNRYVALGGRITPEELNILMEGVVGIDLIGTAQIDVDLDLGERYRLNVYSFSREGDAGTLLNGVQQWPIDPCGLQVLVSGKYVVRKVISGADTIVEGDDSIAFKEGNFEQSVHRIVDDAGLSPEVYKVVGPLVHGSGNNPTEIWVRRKGSPESNHSYNPLYLNTVADSVALRDWIKARVESGLPTQFKSGDVVRLYDTQNDTTLPIDKNSLGYLVSVREDAFKCQHPNL